MVVDPPSVVGLTSEKDQLNATSVALEDDVKRAGEVVANAENRLKMLDAYDDDLKIESGAAISEVIEAYQVQRDIIFQDQLKGKFRARQLRNEVPS